MATLTVKELAARYRLAAQRQALVERFKAAATLFKPGDRVRVKPNHNFKEWHGDVGVIDKYVPFSKYYVNLEKNGRVIIDESYIEDEAKKTSPEEARKEAAFAFLRESKFSWLAMGMAEMARKSGERFGMRDAAGVLKSWFAGRSPKGPKEEAGYQYIQGGAGQLLMNGLIKGVTAALKETGGGAVGLKDVGEAIVAFAEDK